MYIDTRVFGIADALYDAVCCNMWQCMAVRCSVLQRVAACCSVLQCVDLLNTKSVWRRNATARELFADAPEIINTNIHINIDICTHILSAYIYTYTPETIKIHTGCAWDHKYVYVCTYSAIYIFLARIYIRTSETIYAGCTAHISICICMYTYS